MFQLERISQEAIPAALAKAMRYRLLNEPVQAESICLDILEVDSSNQQALETLVLAISDQFIGNAPADPSRARELIPRLAGAYQRAYYTGILAERQAMALIRRGEARHGGVAYNLLREAMDCYQQARGVAPPGIDDAILRWNACARTIQRNSHVEPAQDVRTEQMLE